jgi:chemosensory pili system protein ChpA (sensor histidine kinase/response regulator)
MQLVDKPIMSDQDLSVKDLGPLSWVIEELRKTFDTSIKGLKRFLNEANATQSDLAVIDTNLLRSAKHNFHQISGALRLLEIYESAIFAEAMEAVAGRFVQRPALVTDDAVIKLEHASFAVLEYLECLLAAKDVSSIGLFAQYRDIKLLAGFDRAHPADLWIREPFQWLQPSMPAIRTLDYSPSVRDALDSALLKIMVSSDAIAADELCQVSLSLAQSQRNEKAATFWKVCAAFFEALAQKLIPVDIYAKRSAAGIVIHYNNLKHGDWVFSDKFMQNMLFLCQQAKIEKKENSPYLLAVQKTWALQEAQVVNYENSHFGRFDPALLALSKKRIVVAKELWTSLSGGDIQKIRGTSEQFKLVAESLIKLYPSSQPLAQALINASDMVFVNKQPPAAEFAMEVATAILYLEAVFEGWGSTDSVMELRAKKLAQRIDNVRNGGQSENVEPWIEELYRRISDRESLGSVVGELRICLTDVEKSIDQYFRSPLIPQVLQSVPGKLSQMRGILSVLGLDEAVSAVVNMRDRIDEFESPSFDFERARVEGVFDKFGNNLGALGFLIDMLNYQPALVKKLFVFDVKTACLNPLMGRVHKTIDSYAQEVVTEIAADVTAEDDSSNFDAPIDASIFAPISEPVAIPVPELVIAPISALLTVQVDEKVVENRPVVSQKLTDEYELRDIFLDEAAEVIETGLAAAKALLHKPENLEQQSTLRRAFHTLKGSSRMVGFDDFGEAGWSFEQVINTRLTDQTHFDDAICTLAIAALNAFGMWADDLRLGNSTKWNSQPFKSCADAMRIEGRLDTTGLVGGGVGMVENVVESLPKVESDDEAFLRSLENFELFELPADEVPSIISDNLETDDVDVDVDVDVSKPRVESTEDIDRQSIAADEVSFVDVNEKVDGEVKAEIKVEVQADAEEKIPVTIDNAAALPIPIAPADDQEQFKIIGALKIGIPLYNVYLNEADEWSRCLVTELDEWAIEHHKPLNISTVNFAHSLAGSSATVGFYQLSGLAKQLEKALDKVYLKSNGTETEAVVFAQAAEECRRLLHQFAAGFLEEPKASVIARLNNLKFPEAPQAVVASNNIVSLQKKTEISKPKQPALVEVPVRSSIVNDFDAVKNPIAHHVVQILDNDDDIELVDSLDPDLFHIFEEEARDLLPKLGGSLREWVANPEDLNARSEVLRTLHTLKGSSRLAGAMRLGELSHRMESEIESIGSENLTTESVEPLLSRLDGIQNIFEVITKPIEASDAVDLQYQDVAKIKQHVAEIELIKPTVAKPIDKSSIEDASVKAPQNTSQTKTAVKPPASSILKSDKRESRQSVRVRARLLDRLVNQAGEVMLTRTRIESELGQLRGSLGDLTGNLDRLRQQLRDVEFQAETQMQSRMEQAKDSPKSFDPLEFDRFTRVQELTRMMAESVNDVATVQRSLQRTVDSTEDDLVAQARQTRDLQRDLLRTRMEEFESISDRLYRVVRQASKDAEKQVKLDIVGGSIEMDRGVLERMTPSFEHLLRNCIAHGLESADKRLVAGKEAVGAIAITLLQDGNDIIIEFSDDGSGLNYQRIREQAVAQKLIDKKDQLTDAETVNLIFTPGLSTASQVTELSGRGIGLDVVRAEVIALGGRIDVSSEANKGTKFKLVLPLTTAVTQVVMMRTGSLSFGVPSHLVEVVRRSPLNEVEKAYADEFWGAAEDSIPFYWSGALLQASQRSNEPLAKTNPVVIFRSAGQRIALHVDEIFGNKEVVIKNLGPQLARLPGLAGMAILVSGAVALIYNPVALASVYGASIQQYKPISADQSTQSAGSAVISGPSSTEQQTPLILVVDDSITVRRVTQRMLQREGFRVVLAVDGLNAIEKLNLEIPAVVLSDIEMPRMDGFDLVRNIRADSKLKHLPVVMITSRIAEKHRELAMELGVNDYLGKPYSEEGLLAVLRQHTAKKLNETEKV